MASSKKDVRGMGVLAYVASLVSFETRVNADFPYQTTCWPWGGQHTSWVSADSLGCLNALQVRVEQNALLVVRATYMILRRGW